MNPDLCFGADIEEKYRIFHLKLAIFTAVKNRGIFHRVVNVIKLT